MQLYEDYGGTMEELLVAKKLTFLIGAGVSMNPPSNLPSARAMTRSLLEYLAPPEEIDTILLLQPLRYELLVEIIQAMFDPKLVFLDYFDKVTTPNLVHLFLAQMIARGNHVITTNFDYLIEQALMKLTDQRDYILPVITQNDFMQYQDPQALSDAQKLPLYKIHGSKRNIMTGEETVDSLITTTSALGKHKEGGTSFAIEPFKKPALHNLMRGRTLVVMGYSGNDDFDIGPMLKEFPDLERLIWIDHEPSANTIQSVRINKITEENAWTGESKATRLLGEIRGSMAFDVIRITVNTIEFITRYAWPLLCAGLDVPLIDEQSEANLSFEEYAETTFLSETMSATLLQKYMFAVDLYFELGQQEAVYRCLQNGLMYSDRSKNDHTKAFFLKNLGMYWKTKSDYSAAMDCFQQVLQIHEQNNDSGEQANIIRNISEILMKQGNYDQASEMLNKALGLLDQEGDVVAVADIQGMLGKLCQARGQYDEAIQHYEAGLKIDEQRGDLVRKAVHINDIATVYNAQRQYDKAIGNYKEALRIASELGRIDNKMVYLTNIGMIYLNTRKLDDARQYFQDAIEIADQLGDRAKKATILNNMAGIHYFKKEFDQALEFFEQALSIADAIGDLASKGNYLANIAGIQDSLGRYDEALPRLEEAIQISGNIGDVPGKVIRLNNLANLYVELNNIDNAIQALLEAVGLEETLGDVEKKVEMLANLGELYARKKQFQDAANYFDQALGLAEKLGMDPRIKQELARNAEQYRALAGE